MPTNLDYSFQHFMVIITSSQIKLLIFKLKLPNQYKYDFQSLCITNINEVNLKPCYMCLALPSIQAPEYESDCELKQFDFPISSIPPDHQTGTPL